MSVRFGLAQLPSSFQTALGQLAAGDVTDAINTVFDALIGGLVVGPLLNFNGAFQVPVIIAQNFANVVKAVADNVLTVAIAAALPLLTTEAAFADSAGTLFTALTTGDFVTAASVLINLPIVLTGAALNGFEGTPGILNGSIPALLSVQEAIAQALGAPMPMAQVASPKVAALPAAGPMVAVSANPAPKATALPNPTSQAKAANTPPTGGSVTTKVASGPVNKLFTTLNTTNSGNKVVPGQVGGKGTAAGDHVISALSKVGGALPSKGGSHK